MAETRTPPTADGLPLIGSGFEFSRNPIEAMERWAEKGDIVRLRIPGDPMYMVSHPSLIEQVLVEKHDSFSIGPDQRRSFEGVEDHAVTMATGDRWRRLRKALRPLFARDEVARYADRMGKTAAEFVTRWDDRATIDLHNEMRLLTVRLLADGLLDVDVSGNEDVVMAASDALLDRADFSRPGQLLPDWMPTPTDRRFERCVGELDGYVEEILTQHTGAGGGEDALSLLFAARDRGELSMDEVRHNVVALLLAGHESPALALTYAWYLLSDHPDVYESIAAEYDEVADGEPLGSEAYEQLERTRNVVAETLRLYPRTMGVNRQATEAVTIGEYEISEGASVLIPQWIPHRGERFWDDPETFDPSRWREETERPTYAYFPYSGGPRNCIGRQFARYQLPLALATMVGHVEMDVSVDEPLSFRPTIALRHEQEMSATVRRPE